MKKIITIYCLFSTFFAQAQLAIIQDKDGFTNIRAKPSKNSKVITKVMEHQVFWDMTEISDKKENLNWVEVEMGTKLDTLSSTETHQEAAFYIAKTHVLHLDKLNKINNKHIDNQIVILKNKDYEIKITKSLYSQKVNFNKGFGVDGSPPKEEIKSIFFSYKGNSLELNSKFCNVFFEPNFKNTNAYLDSEEYLYLVMENSDGAGAYSVVWIFKKAELIDISIFNRF